MRRPPAENALAMAATDARLLATLLRAGLTPARAWHACAPDSSSTEFLRPIWFVVTFFGSAPGDCLARFARALELCSRAQQDATAHAAGTRLAMRVIVLLPFFSLLAAWTGGYNPFLFLFGSFIGWVLLFTCCSLLFVAYQWLNRIVTIAQRFSWGVGLVAELVSLALSAGASIAQAERCAGNIPQQAFINEGERRTELVETLTVVAFAHQAGAAAADLVRAEAERRRTQQMTRLVEHRQKMAVKILYPLGACVLPAFIGLGVVPVLVAVLSSTQS